MKRKRPQKKEPPAAASLAISWQEDSWSVPLVSHHSRESLTSARIALVRLDSCHLTRTVTGAALHLGSTVRPM